MEMKQGLLHLYTGDGKGKTSAAVGLAVRGCGAGLKVLFVQFLKGGDSSEIAPICSLGIQVLCQEGPVKFVFQMTPEERTEYLHSQAQLMREAFQKAKEEEFDLLVLDEAVGGLSTGVLDLAELCTLLDSRPKGLEVALTGRDAPAELLQRAHYVTNLQGVKHPYEQGQAARRGIEY